MDAAIPLQDRSSQWQDLELNYAIKSIRKFTNADQIYVIGRPRRLFKEDVEFIWLDIRDTYQEYHKRHENVRLKLLKAFPHLSDSFLLTNDDIYFLRPCKLEDMPLYHIGDGKDFAQEKDGKYREMLEALDGDCYEVHTPMVIDKDVFQEATKPFQLYRTLYGNASDRDKKRLKEDVKYYGERSMQELAQLPFVSVSDNRFPRKLRGLIENRIQ